jgi:hypothetical protein
MIGGSASNTLISVISTVLMIEAAMPTGERAMADSRPAIAVSITAFAIIASCATRTGQARWMSCEVEEVERSISVFYGNADLDFVRGLRLQQRCSRSSAGNSRSGDGGTEEAKGKKYCEAPLAFQRMPPARPYSLLSGFRFQAGEFRLVRIGANERLQS